MAVAKSKAELTDAYKIIINIFTFKVVRLQDGKAVIMKIGYNIKW